MYKENYDIVVHGGYLKNKDKKEHFIHRPVNNVGVNRLLNDNILKTINYLSHVELTINIPVLKVIFKLLESKDDRIQSLILSKQHPSTPELFKLNLGGLKNSHLISAILKHNSQYYQDLSVLSSALIYSNFGNMLNSLYLPYFIDFRGRLYPKSGYFSPQSGELSRSLFRYKNEYKLTSVGLESLKVYTANCFGLDKLSIEDRKIWVEDNLDDLLKVGTESN